MILEQAGCATPEVVSGGVICLGITSRNISAGGAADATQCQLLVYVCDTTN